MNLTVFLRNFKFILMKLVNQCNSISLISFCDFNRRYVTHNRYKNTYTNIKYIENEIIVCLFLSLHIMYMCEIASVYLIFFHHKFMEG